MGTHLTIDHLVYATPDLGHSVRRIEELLGVAPVPGGAHLGWGTYNALVGLGGSTYLEVIGPDPAQPEPTSPRPFGIDDLDEPRLVGWCASSRRPLVDVVALARESGFDPGSIVSMSRQRPDGVLLEWSLTVASRATLTSGVLPFFIDWGHSPHPSNDLPVAGLLVDLEIFHPEPRSIDLMLSAVSDDPTLGDEPARIVVHFADRPALAARVQTARGTVVID
ncbi:MAG: hypothetical protein RLZZ269_1045 [Actinomycetota bacterium]